MKRIEMNVQTGEIKIIDLTQEEIADAVTRTAEETANKLTQPKSLTIDALAGLLKAKLILTDADIDGAKK